MQWDMRGVPQAMLSLSLSLTPIPASDVRGEELIDPAGEKGKRVEDGE